MIIEESAFSLYTALFHHKVVAKNRIKIYHLTHNATHAGGVPV